MANPHRPLVVAIGLFVAVATAQVVPPPQGPHGPPPVYHPGSGRPTMEEWTDEKMTEKEKDSAAAAKQSKMAAVDQVASMLEDLQIQVLAEGEAEAATYDKFACFCKTTQKDKTEAISSGGDDKRSLSASIEGLTIKRNDLDEKIQGLLKDISAAEARMKKATETSNQALGVYEKNNADLTGAIFALEEAIKVLKASKAPTLVQLQSIQETVRTAAIMADALELGGASTRREVAMFLQQAPEVPMENYKFHSDGIIATLEKLLKDFRAKKVDVDKEEVSRVAAYDSFMQDHTDLIKAKEKALDGARKEKEDTKAAIAADSAELTTVSATLLDDQEYLDKLNKICRDKALTWDQRSATRQAELHTLTVVIGIIKGAVSGNTTAATIRFVQQKSHVVNMADAVANSESAMNAIEAEAESIDGGDAPAAASFLQRRSEHTAATSVLAAARRHLQALTAPNSAEPAALIRGGRQAVVSMLKARGTELKSTLLISLAGRIAGSDDPFAKVKKLIQELIERLLTEAANEANQKGWCDKSTADAKQSRDLAAEAIARLNAEMANLEAAIGKFKEQIDTLANDIQQLETGRQIAVVSRAEEKAENAKTVVEARQGLEAVKQATTILTRFYKTSAKGTVDLSLAQQSPADDAPDAGFAIGEAYLGSQSEAGGIIGMLEVIASDFERTIKETQEAEAAAEQEHLTFMTETGKSLAEKNTAKDELTKYLSEAEAKYENAADELDSQTGLLQSALQALLELKPACVDTGMRYSDRVSRREEEIAALKKALCILGHYENYGPEGLSDSC